jgi:hypothetical protein
LPAEHHNRYEQVAPPIGFVAAVVAKSRLRSMTSGQNGEVGVQVGKLWGFRASELNGWLARIAG